MGPEAGGTVDLYSQQHFWRHQLHDVIPYLLCCKGLFSDCSAYYDKRPSSNGEGYNKVPPGIIMCVCMCIRIYYAVISNNFIGGYILH